MTRLLLFWVIQWRKQLLGFGLAVCGPFIMFLISLSLRETDEIIGLSAILPFAMLLFTLLAIAATKCKLMFRQLWHCRKLIWQMRAVEGRNILLYYPLDLQDRMDMPKQLESWEKAQDDVQKRFGFPLKRRTAVFLTPTVAEASCLLYHESVATAYPAAHAIWAGADVLRTATEAEEIARHELAHLFAVPRNQRTPWFLHEGLATWIQGTHDGKPIDFYALAIILGRGCVPVYWMLYPAWACLSMRAVYAVAGSFTGFLIRRFGWETYWQFFRGAKIRKFGAIFETAFDMGLLEADRQWRRELLERRPEFEPDLGPRIAMERALAALMIGRMLDCLAECEDLLRAESGGEEIAWIASAAHYSLGNFDAAAKLLQQAMDDDEDSVRLQRANAWLMLGKLSDLRGRREEAVQAYQQALDQPDCWDNENGSTHAETKKLLKRPFTEREFTDRLLRHRQLVNRMRA